MFIPMLEEFSYLSWVRVATYKEKNLTWRKPENKSSTSIKIKVNQRHDNLTIDEDTRMVKDGEY